MSEPLPPAPQWRPPELPVPSDLDIRTRSRRITRRAFTVGAVSALAGLAGWQWLRTRPDEDGIPWPLRRMLQFDERLSRLAFRETRLAPTFPENAAAQGGNMRINGRLGLHTPVDHAAWRLRVDVPNGRSLSFTLDQLIDLPRTELVTELKCIEGWSQVLSWAGVAFRDFLMHYRLGTRSGAAPDLGGKREDLYHYVGLATPDGEYYVGLDMESALHPQTLLCYEMGGQPLTPAHGAPLRLTIPVKYGIKNIKRIGRIFFSDDRPRDYWAERGYDWYSGH